MQAFARADGTPAYNLVVVVDDEFQGVGQVVRGDDLLDSTPRHAYLQRLLGFAEPVWSHVPLVVDERGERLSKRDGSAGLEAWCALGGTIDDLLAGIARTLGIEGGEPTLRAMADGFDPDAVPREPATFSTNGPELSLRR